MNARHTASAIVCAVTLTACNGLSLPGLSNSAATPFNDLAARAPRKIYVANVGNGTITTYKPNGEQTTPTINVGRNYLVALAVDGNGKIYALSFDALSGRGASGIVTSYNPDGSPTTLAISVKERGYREAVGIAVDGSGKIYVLSSAHNGSPGIVTTYTADGSPTTPRFRTGPDSSSLAIDANGKVYVTNDTGKHGKCSVTAYLPDGTRTTPTITRDLREPSAVTIDPSGTIYIANNTNGGPDGTGAGYLTSYSAGGSELGKRFAHGPGAPGGIAYWNGRLYVASSTAYRDILKTYKPDGKRIAPTITAGLYEPSGIVIH